MSNEIASLSVTDASNTARFPENMSPASVNDSARALEGMIARRNKDTDGSLTAAGGTTAYTLAINSTTTAAARGERLKFKINATNTGPVTLNVTPSGGSARGAVAVQKGTLALVAGDWIIGDIVEVDYDGTQYQMVTPDRAVTGTGKNVRDTAPTISAPVISGHATIEGVTPTGATGTGKMVFDGSPTLVTPTLGVAAATSINFGGSALSSYVGATAWTPAYTLGGGSVTYTNQFGRYMRVGDYAFCWGRITVNVATTPSGALRISGLPFTVVNSSQEGGVASVEPQTWASSLTTVLCGRLEGNATTIRLQKYSATTGAVSDPGGDVASGCDLFFTFILPIV